MSPNKFLASELIVAFFLESALLSLVLIIVGLPQIEIDIKELAFNVQTWLYG